MDFFFLHQRCPPISIYSSLFSYGAYVSPRHMYLTGWNLIPFLLSYFLLKMESVMNDLHCHKKVVTYLTKISKWLWYDIITKSTINSLPITLYTSANVLRNCWCSQKVFLKISQISCFSVGSAEFLRIHFF